jgi:hypothetical protein
VDQRPTPAHRGVPAELDRERAELDRERISDERFAKLVELLGKEADQIQVGALNALSGLARAHLEYTQTVLDAARFRTPAI